MNFFKIQSYCFERRLGLQVLNFNEIERIKFKKLMAWFFLLTFFL